jgi:hypothetical protein
MVLFRAGHGAGKGPKSRRFRSGLRRIFIGCKAHDHDEFIAVNVDEVVIVSAHFVISEIALVNSSLPTDDKEYRQPRPAKSGM